MKKKLQIIIAVLIATLALLLVVTYRTMSQAGAQVLFVYIFLAAVLLIACVQLAKWVMTEVIAPMDKLKESFREMEKGNFDHILDTDRSDEIGEVCEEFEKLRMSLKTDSEQREQMTRENRELISNISHDLKTPITAIKGYAEGILDGVVTTPAQQEKYVRTIYNKADDMARLIDELTYYTRIDTNRIPYTFAKVAPVEFFFDCVDEVSTDMESKGIEFTHSSDVSKETIVIADVEQLKKVVYNIINNAVKYMDKTPGKIDIRLKDDGDFVRFEIEDNGKGIAQADLPNLFDRFYRTDASRNSKTGGSGIGLSIARKIMEDHGGRIWASSREGVGTTFTFILRKYRETEENE